MPKYIVRILAYWYAPTRLCQYNGAIVSAPFGVSNGVRQKGESCPQFLLICIWMGDVCNTEVCNTEVCNTGCMIGNIFADGL